MKLLSRLHLTAIAARPPARAQQGDGRRVLHVRVQRPDARGGGGEVSDAATSRAGRRLARGPLRGPACQFPHLVRMAHDCAIGELVILTVR